MLHEYKVPLREVGPPAHPGGVTQGHKRRKDRAKFSIMAVLVREHCI